MPAGGMDLVQAAPREREARVEGRGLVEEPDRGGIRCRRSLALREQAAKVAVVRARVAGLTAREPHGALRRQPRPNLFGDSDAELLLQLQHAGQFAFVRP